MKPTTSSSQPQSLSVSLKPYRTVLQMAFTVMARQMFTTPMRSDSTIALSYVVPSILPAIIYSFIHWGRSASKRLTPKNVPSMAPNTVVTMPSVMTMFIMPAKDLDSFFFKMKPKAISTRP